MKRKFLQFPTGAHLPIIKGRNRHNDGQNICYRNGANDDDDDDDGIDAKLTALKSALEKTLTKKQREDLEDMIERFEEKQEKRQAKKDKEIELKQAEADKLAAELKAANEKTAKDLTEATTKAATLETTVKELKENADKNQQVIDAFVKEKDNDKRGPLNKKSFFDHLKETVEASHDDIQKFANKETKRLTLDIKAVADFSTANVTGGSVWGAQYRPGIIENPNQIGHIRDVLQISPAGPGTDYYFMRENGAGEGAPAPTAEKQAAAAVSQATGLKPQFDIDLIESSVKFEIISGFMLLSRKSMQNIPGLLSFLNRRVPQKLMDVEDAQILYGNGTSPNLKGITHADNSVDSTSTADVLAEAIIDDIALLEDTYKRMASRILLRPLDYHGFFKNKASGSGEYDLPRNVTFVNGVLFIGGVPAFKTTALNSGTYIVGDFANGAELLIQNAMRLEFFEQDSTNVRTNQVTLRIEEVVALPVFGGDYFINGTVPVASV